MAKLKYINYPRMIFDSLTDFFSVNSEGNLSFMYRFMTGWLWVFQDYFDSFDAFRQKILIIAQCKFTIGQLTNTLNALYDSLLNRIYIGQASYVQVDTLWYGEPDTDELVNTLWYGEPDTDELVNTAWYGESVIADYATINIPAALSTTDIEATIKKIAPEGLNYTINYF